MSSLVLGLHFTHLVVLLLQHLMAPPHLLQLLVHHLQLRLGRYQRVLVLLMVAQHPLQYGSQLTQLDMMVCAQARRIRWMAGCCAVPKMGMRAATTFSPLPGLQSRAHTLQKPTQAHHPPLIVLTLYCQNTRLAQQNTRPVNFKYCAIPNTTLTKTSTPSHCCLDTYLD